MSNLKRILIQSHSLHAIERNFENLWDDIWLRFKQRRRTIRLAPCVLASAMIDWEIEHCLEALKEHEEKALIANEEVEDLFGTEIPVNHLELAEFYRQELAKWRSLKNGFNGGAEIIIDRGEDKDALEIFLRADTLTRRRIEVGLERFLRDAGYVKPGSRLKFTWQKPGIIIRSFPEY